MQKVVKSINSLNQPLMTSFGPDCNSAQSFPADQEEKHLLPTSIKGFIHLISLLFIFQFGLNVGLTILCSSRFSQLAEEKKYFYLFPLIILFFVVLIAGTVVGYFHLLRRFKIFNCFLVFFFIFLEAILVGNIAAYTGEEGVVFMNVSLGMSSIGVFLYFVINTKNLNMIKSIPFIVIFNIAALVLDYAIYNNDKIIIDYLHFCIGSVLEGFFFGFSFIWLIGNYIKYPRYGRLNFNEDKILFFIVLKVDLLLINIFGIFFLGL